MDDALQRIAALAWRTVPATEANQAILRARRATAAAEAAASRGALDASASADPARGDPEPDLDLDDPDAPMARAYELVLPPGATFESFARVQLPRFVYHLESIGAHPPRASGVVVCLFAGDQLHFLQAGELLAAICAELAISSEELVRRYGTGELRTAIRAAPAPDPRAPSAALTLTEPPPAPATRSNAASEPAAPDAAPLEPAAPDPKHEP